MLHQGPSRLVEQLLGHGEIVVDERGDSPDCRQLTEIVRGNRLERRPGGLAAFPSRRRSPASASRVASSNSPTNANTGRPRRAPRSRSSAAGSTSGWAPSRERSDRPAASRPGPAAEAGRVHLRGRGPRAVSPTARPPSARRCPARRVPRPATTAGRARWPPAPLAGTSPRQRQGDRAPRSARTRRAPRSGPRPVPSHWRRRRARPAVRPLAPVRLRGRHRPAGSVIVRRWAGRRERPGLRPAPNDGHRPRRAPSAGTARRARREGLRQRRRADFERLAIPADQGQQLDLQQGDLHRPAAESRPAGAAARRCAGRRVRSRGGPGAAGSRPLAQPSRRRPVARPRLHRRRRYRGRAAARRRAGSARCRSIGSRG